MRKHFLIKPEIQLRHLALTLGAITVSTLLGYVFLESMLSSFLRMQPLSEAEWITLRVTLRWGFLFIFLIMLAIVFIEHYMFLHSVVGPLHVLEVAIKKMANGEFHEPVKVRQSDQLKDLIASFEDMRKKILARIEKKP